MDHKEYKPSYIPFYFFVLLLVSVPLSITFYFENPVDLVKKSAFIIMGSFFIIFSLVLTTERTGRTENKFTLEINKSLDIPVLFFMLAVILSTIFSLNPVVSIFGQYQRGIGLITFLYLTIIYFILSGLLRDIKRFTLLFVITELIAVIVSVYSFMQMAGFDPFGIQAPGLDRPVSTFGNSVFLGGFLSLIFPFSVLNISAKKNRILKLLYPAIILAGIIISGTRSAYFAVFAEITVILLVYFLINKTKESSTEKKQFTNRFKILFIASAAAVVLLILYIIIYPNSFLTNRLISIFYTANNPRLVLWMDSFNLFYKYPFTGTGLAMFSSAFEEFYSNRLRLLESSSYFDHPHNNYLFILYSMGLPGLAAYLGILVLSVKRCLKNIFKSDNVEIKVKFTAFLAFITGYCIYGLTNFDDISILLYLFIFLAALRSQDTEKVKTIAVNTKLISLISVPVILLIAFNIYSSINDLKADRFFKLGNNLIRQGKFAEAVYNMNTAIALNDHFTDYRYALAYTVYRQCFASEVMTKESKFSLLNQASQQVEGLKNSHYFINECKGLLSLIYYEMDRTDEAKVLENEVLTKDSVNITYRINLARYYMKKGDYNRAGELMNVVMAIRPKSPDAYFTAAYLHFKTGNFETAKLLCRQILAVEPANQFAIKLLSDIETSEKNK